jgi:hypothetical protein
MDKRRVKRISALVLLVYLTVSACSGAPTVDSSENGSRPVQPNADATATTVPTTEPTIVPSPTPLIVITATPIAETPTPSQTQPASAVAENYEEKLRCFSFASWGHDELEKPGSLESLQALADTGANCVILVVTVYQEDVDTTQVFSTNNTASDRGLEYITEEAKKLGLRVVLKPHLNNLSNRWSANIGRGVNPYTAEQRDKWFYNYTQFVLHYARLAEKNGIEGLSVGNELGGMTPFENEWRELILAVRQVFSGWLTYASTTGETMSIKFWDELDYIGLNAYYPISDGQNISFEAMGKRFADEAFGVINVAGILFERPVLITEIGYRSIKGATASPENYAQEGEIDLEEQKIAYEAVLSMLSSIEESRYYGGVAFWYWDPRPHKRGPDDADYTVWGKPAEEVVKSYWKK